MRSQTGLRAAATPHHQTPFPSFPKHRPRGAGAPSRGRPAPVPRQRPAPPPWSPQGARSRAAPRAGASAALRWEPPEGRRAGGPRRRHGGVNGQRPPRGGRAGSASQSTAGAFHFPRGVNPPPSATAALAAPQKQSAAPAVTSFTRCPQGWVVPAHLSPLCRAVVAAAPPLRLPPRKRRGWCVPAAGASRPAPAPPRRVIDVVVCVAGAAGQAGAAARGRRRGAGAGARDVGVRGGGGRRLPAQRAGGPHFLLPGGPRPAAGLGRLLALAGVPLLPGALAAPPPQPPRLARRAPAPRVPHAQVRLVCP